MSKSHVPVEDGILQDLKPSHHLADEKNSLSSQQDGPSSPPTNTPIEYPGPGRLALTVLALVLNIFIVALDMTIVGTAVPRITSQFHSLDDVGWYGAAFLLPFACFQASWGKAYTYFSVKTCYLLSGVVFEVGSLICAVAPNSTALICGRAVAGLGAAGIGVGMYTIIAFSVEPQKRAVFAGLLGATFGVASVIGPLIVSCNFFIMRLLQHFPADHGVGWCFYGQRLMALVFLYQLANWRFRMRCYCIHI